MTSKTKKRIVKTNNLKSLRFTITAIVILSGLAVISILVYLLPSTSRLFFKSRASNEELVFGTLQSDPIHADKNYTSGIRLANVGLNWGQMEPQEGVINQTYLNSVKSQITSFKSKGMKIVLGLGIQYPPTWLFNYPNSRYVNQYGDVYLNTASGKNIANMVFNQNMRNKQSWYIAQVFNALGTDFYAVRLGGGWYGELNYPDNNWNGHTNSYWGFDDMAQGRATGLPTGVERVPIVGWMPGSPSTNHDSARLFANWYMNSLKNYQDWQINTLRSFYPGKLAILYPSWGIRPGQLDAAINVDLNGSTSPEINGEVQRGFDFSRYIAGITDPLVVVYTTWIDANFGNDNSTSLADWTPAHYLSSLAYANPLHLQTWGENTGHNNYTDMQRSFQKMKDYNLIGLMWAFEPELYGGVYATIDQYAGLISQYVGPTPTVSPSPTTPSPQPTSTPIGTTDNTPPTVSITQPVNNQVLIKNSTISINASAADNVSVNKVEFYTNTTLLCVDMSSPYSCNWRVPGKPKTSYDLKATAYDASGNSSSALVKVIVN